MKATETSPQIFHLASERLKDDVDIVLLALYQTHLRVDSQFNDLIHVLARASPELSDNRALVLYAKILKRSKAPPVGR